MAPLNRIVPITLLLLAGCATEKSATAPAPTATSTAASQPAASPTPAATGAIQAKPEATASLAALGVRPIEKTPEAQIENLWWLRPPGTVDNQGGLISGGLPENDAAFAKLEKLGVKTIVSVDGASPDVDAAARHGMTYIHIPTQYARVTGNEQLEVSRAINSSLDKGNVYIHCHHGKHRSPAQAAAAAVGLGWMSADQAVAYMKRAGTADIYQGLYSCVAESEALPAAELNAPVRPGEFVPLKKPAGLVDAMIAIDAAYDHLNEIKLSGWAVPKDHPDLVAADEAGKLTDHFRFSGEDPRAKVKGDDFTNQLAKAVASSTALEAGILRKDDSNKLDALWAPVASSCKDCHKQYRDKR